MVIGALRIGEPGIASSPFEVFTETGLEIDTRSPLRDAVSHCFVFNVGHNRYRLVAKINFQLKQVFIRAILTHAE